MLNTYSNRKACNTYILFNDSKKGILVDPGLNNENRLIEHIQKLDVEIVAILITHAHYDHITALKDVLNLFPNAVTYINEDEVELLGNSKLNLSKFRDDGFSDVLEFVPSKLVALSDNEEFVVENYKIRMIKTPFHTQGSACFYVESENILFSGDTLFYSAIGRIDLPTGSARTIESSLKKLLALPMDTKVYPGHSIATTLEREAKYNPYLRNI